MDSIDYDNRMFKLLNNRSHYQKSNKEEWNTLKEDIRKMLMLAKDDDILCEQEFSFMLNTDPLIPALYGLPKIHKDTRDPPMRPIVSCIGSLTEPLSKYVEVFLQPLVQKQKAYIKDTTSMIKKIEGLSFNPETQVLVTLDIEALYTNIPQDDTIEIMEHILSGDQQDMTDHQAFILECITVILKNNIFIYKDELFRQIKGTSMGATCAPSLACLYVSKFEDKHIYNITAPFYENISEWGRYIDDIFFIWTGDMETLNDFLTWLNCGDVNLKFTSHVSKNCVEFLDIIIKVTGGYLSVELYTKPTDRNSMLHFNSNHPASQKNNIPFGQFLRLRRNCTSMPDYDRHATILKEKFIERGYPKRMVRHAYKRAKYFNRETLFQPRDRTQKNQPIMFVTNFSQVSHQVKNIINRNWHLVADKTATPIPKPMFSFRRNRTIRNSLVHTYRDIPKTVQTTIDGNPLPTGTYPCSGCVNCASIIKGSKITANERSVNIKSFINCRTTNIIYLIQCPCQKSYVGETSREVRLRLNEHRSALRTNKTGAPLTEHWRIAGHTIDDLKWCGLERVIMSKRGGNVNDKRKKREQFFMSTLNSVRSGLNSREDWEKIIR
ncbi:uncharacterized protein LOC144792032 [Lissotriton helveticus]